MDYHAINEIANPDEIRVMIFINGQLIHAPLSELLKAVGERITELEARVDALENP